MPIPACYSFVIFMLFLFVFLALFRPFKICVASSYLYVSSARADLGETLNSSFPLLPFSLWVLFMFFKRKTLLSMLLRSKLVFCTCIVLFAKMTLLRTKW